MPRLTLIVGLPGSGKSHHATTRFPDATYFHDVRHPEYKDVESSNLQGVVDRLRAGGDCVADDASFCIQAERAKFIADLRERAPEVEVEINVIYFEKT